MRGTSLPPEPENVATVRHPSPAGSGVGASEGGAGVAGVASVGAEAAGVVSAAVMRFDVAPLSLTILSYHRDWRLQQIRAD